MARETPQQVWERMTRERAGASPSETPPDAAEDPAAQEADAGQPSAAEPAPAGPTPHAPPVGGQAESQSTGGDQSAGDLVKQLSEQTSALIRQEMRLAQVELREKGKKAGIGAGLFGAGGLVAFFGAAALITAAVLALSTALAAWLSALIVGMVLLAAAGLAALMGKKQVEEATPPAPERAVESVKRDVDTVKRSARR